MGTTGETGVAAGAVACRFFAAADLNFLFAILAGHNQYGIEEYFTAPQHAIKVEKQGVANITARQFLIKFPEYSIW